MYSFIYCYAWQVWTNGCCGEDVCWVWLECTLVRYTTREFRKSFRHSSAYHVSCIEVLWLTERSLLQSPPGINRTSVRDVMWIWKHQTFASYQEGLDAHGCDSPTDILFLKKRGRPTLRTTREYELLNTLGREFCDMLAVQNTEGYPGIDERRSCRGLHYWTHRRELEKSE